MFCFWTASFSSCKVVILSSKAAISSEHPQVGDGGRGLGDGGGGLGGGIGGSEGDGDGVSPDAAGITAVAPTPCSTQEAASSLIRRLPLTLRDMRVAVLRKTSEDGAERRKGRLADRGVAEAREAWAQGVARRRPARR